MEIKIRFSTTDRYSETRKFKTLLGAQKYAQKKIGPHPEISTAFGYAVGSYGDAKIQVSGDATLVDLFPPAG